MQNNYKLVYKKNNFKDKLNEIKLLLKNTFFFFFYSIYYKVLY